MTAAAVASTHAAAVGEIGLDYHYDFAPRDVQRDVFAEQVALAVAHGLPIVVHTREAAGDTLAVLREAGQGLVRGVMHCFSGTIDEARLMLDLGFFISLAGMITFPKADAIREVGRFVPGDRLLVETDAPFLAPVPHRGKRNEPAWIIRTVEALAAVRGDELASLDARISDNFNQLIPAPLDREIALQRKTSSSR
jgi:TatD DNase family protein